RPLRSYQPHPNTLWSRPIRSRASRSDALYFPWRKVGAQLRWSQGKCSAALRLAGMESQAPAFSALLRGRLLDLDPHAQQVPAQDLPDVGVLVPALLQALDQV